jgi:hypothetical protein
MGNRVAELDTLITPLRNDLTTPRKHCTDWAASFGKSSFRLIIGHAEPACIGVGQHMQVSFVRSCFAKLPDTTTAVNA